MLVTFAGEFIGRQLIEDFQLLPREERDGGIFDERLFVLQKPIKPAKHRHLQFLCVFVRSFGYEQAEFVSGAIQIVNVPDFFVQARHAIEREDGVFIAVTNQQGPRCDQRRHQRKVPAISVHHEHAVAMAFDGALHDMIFKIRNAGDGTCHLDTIIERGDPP